MPRRRKKRTARSLGTARIVRQIFHPAVGSGHARLLHPESILYFCLIVLAAFALVRAIRFFPGIESSILGYASNITAEEVLAETNVKRVELGLEPLVLNDELSQAALAKGQDMFADQYWSHVAPDGEEPWDFITRAGYGYRTAGENLARDFMTTSDMMAAWMNSPTHRENIVSDKFEEIGIAVIDGKLQGFETTLVVQMFGAPQGAGAPARLLGEAAQEEATEQVLAGTVLAPVSGRDSVLLTPLQLTKAFFLAVILLIGATLVYDSFVAGNRRAVQAVSKNIGHLAALGAVTFILVFFRSGIIH